MIEILKEKSAIFHQNTAQSGSVWPFTMFLLYAYADLTTDQDPVVQRIVSLMISLSHKFVKQISAKVTNTLLFFVEKCENPLQCKGFSHFFNEK